MELKSWNYTPELKIIKLPKRRGGEVSFAISVERVRVKPKKKNYLHHEREKVFEEKVNQVEKFTFTLIKIIK